MFDVGFWEIMVIMVVALLVVGPERLPRLARTAGLWIGKMRSFVQSVKADIDRELAAEELRRVLAKQAQMPELQELVDETRRAVDAAQPDHVAKALPDEPEKKPEQSPAKPTTAAPPPDSPND